MVFFSPGARCRRTSQKKTPKKKKTLQIDAKPPPPKKNPLHKKKKKTKKHPKTTSKKKTKKPPKQKKPKKKKPTLLRRFKKASPCVGHLPPGNLRRRALPSTHHRLFLRRARPSEQIKTRPRPQGEECSLPERSEVLCFSYAAGEVVSARTSPELSCWYAPV